MTTHNRFRNKVLASKATLFVAICACLLMWAPTMPFVEAIQSEATPDLFFGRWLQEHVKPSWSVLMALVLYAFIGFLLTAFNNAFNIIRVKISAPTFIYFLLVSAIVFIHYITPGDVASIAFIWAVYFLCKSYENENASPNVFYAFMFLGLGSFFFPHLIYLVPVFWVGMFDFKSLNIRSFFASLLGVIFPYLFLATFASATGRMEYLLTPVTEMAEFYPLFEGITPERAVAFLLMTLLAACSMLHYWHTEYEDKVKTRNYIKFLILLAFVCLLFVSLQPIFFVDVMPILIMVTSILAAHYFVLTDTRRANIVFIGFLIGVVALFAANMVYLAKA